MLPIGKSIKILLSLLLSISFSFPLKSEASTKKRSHIYREAIQTLMSGNAQIEKVLVVVAQDKNEIVTTKLRELNIELDKVSSKKASGDLKEIIFKVLAEEYINARKVELVEFSSYIENSRMNPEQKKYVLKDEIERQAQERNFRKLWIADKESIAA